MGADNWRVCPVCANRHESKVADAKIKIVESYGKVDRIEYEQLKVDLQVLKENTPDETLREDYEVGIDDNNQFYLLYTGRCTTCEWAFIHKVNVDLINNIKMYAINGRNKNVPK
jgi:hypothetical protein